jgi:serine/threonine protein kinase
MGGGDFLMLLLQKAPLREDETRFYLAEMINGIDACHKLGFIHRDVKVRYTANKSDFSLITFFSRQVAI